jgi:2-oxoglutarate dehydrogenase E1 component
MRRAKRLRDVVLVRLEQISPFPHDLLTAVIRQYTNAELVWCQEEPKNMGAWDYVRPRLRTALSAGVGEGAYPDAAAAAGNLVQVRYVGRPAAASPATASFAIHQKETQEILEAALAP